LPDGVGAGTTGEAMRVEETMRIGAETEVTKEVGGRVAAAAALEEAAAAGREVLLPPLPAPGAGAGALPLPLGVPEPSALPEAPPP
jgi:hypothetical protein